MKHLIALVIAATGLMTAPALAADYSDPFARDLKILTQWFEGQFDNAEQLWFENLKASGVDAADRHKRLHVMHRRLNAPQLGAHVFYVEEYVDNDPAQIIRQRFVTFQSDPKAGAIRMRQGFFKDKDAATGAYQDTSKLATLTAEDVFFMDDVDPAAQCDVFWRRQGAQFVGRITPKGCVFGEGEKRRYSVHTMWLSQDTYWRADATYLVADDSLHVGDGEDRPAQMRRAFSFTCSLSERQEDGSLREVASAQAHNQGGIATLTGSDGAAYTLLMRQKEYPFYETRPDFLYFSVRKAGEKRSLAYSVNDPSARQFGIGVGSNSFFCHRAGYDFRQDSALLPRQ